MSFFNLLGFVAGLIGIAGCASVNSGVARSVAAVVPAQNASLVHRYDHVVIVLMENTGYSSIIGNTLEAPYINSLADLGVTFSNAHGITHPSQPNYLGLFSGSTQGITGDTCPQHFTGVANLGSQLMAAGLSFAGYSEAMPENGYAGCHAGNYARKHNPWANFDNVPNTSNLTFAEFPTDFTALPTLAIVVPDLCNDLHNCPIATGDAWLKKNLGGYIAWTTTHNSLFVLTWDEDDFTEPNQIPMLFAGANLVHGDSSQLVNHYDVLRTLEDMYGLSALGHAANATPITGVWQSDRPRRD
jgi:hypothetical protein